MVQISLAPPKQDTAADWSKYIRELWNDRENTARKEASKQVVDYYKNDQRKYLEQALRQIYTDPQDRADKRRWTQNITKQIVDALAQAYSCRVKRTVAKMGVRNAEVLDKKVFQGINKKMRNANKWLVLERTTLLFCRWSAKHSRINYRAYHQFEFDKVVDPGSAEGELLGVILSDYKSLEESNIVIYTHTNTYWFKGVQLQKQVTHNLGVLPFVVLHAEDPGFEDYLMPDISLANANLEINLALSNLLNIHQKQAHAVPVITLPPEMPRPHVDDANPNAGDPTQVENDQRLDIHGPGKALVLSIGDGNETPDFKFVSPNVNFSGAIETIRFVINSLSQTYGVDSGIFNIDVSGNPATIFHVNEKRREAIVGDLKEVFIDGEKELFERSYALAKMSDPVIPTADVEDFVVEFISDASIIDQLKSTDVVNLRKEGVIDDIEVVRHHYGDKSRTEAEAFLNDMMEAQKRLDDLRLEIFGEPEPVVAEEPVAEEPVPEEETE